MSQTKVRAAARCEDCQKVYRVPDPDRVYTCKACGGRVLGADAEGELKPVAGGFAVCTDCQTLNPPEAESCRECQADLGEAELVEDEQAAGDLMAQAKRAFQRGASRGKVIAWTYHFGALAYGVAALFAVLALRRTEVPIEGGVLVVALTTLLSILMGTAALHLSFQPFLWTLAVALLATAVAGVHAVGPDPYGLALYGSAAWALLSWILLVPAKKFHSLIVHHKDLYVLHHASQETKRSLKGRSPGERHERLMRAMRRADQRAWKISAVAAALLIGASAVGSSLVLDGARPQVFDEALAEFEATWNAGRAADLAALYDERARAAQSIWIEAVTEGHGWSAGLPVLPEGARREQPGQVFVDYEVQRVPLTASFQLSELRWRLTRLELPYPPIAGTLERFRSAWSAGDPLALAAFFAAENRATMEQRLLASKASRGWESFPPITDTQVIPEGERNFIVRMSLEKGKLVTKWFFRDDGAWGLYIL